MGYQDWVLERQKEEKEEQDKLIQRTAEMLGIQSDRYYNATEKVNTVIVPTSRNQGHLKQL